MAVDTRNRRASCLNFDFGGGRVFPDPDGSLANNADRQHVAGKYPGIPAGAPAGVTGILQYRSFFRGVAEHIWGRIN